MEEILNDEMAKQRRVYYKDGKGGVFYVDKETAESVKEYILEKEKEKKIVILTHEGFVQANIEEIIKLPTMELLYDLNRDRATILTFIDDLKWVNDYACMLIIEKLKSLLTTEEIENKLNKDKK